VEVPLFGKHIQEIAKTGDAPIKQYGIQTLGLALIVVVVLLAPDMPWFFKAFVVLLALAFLFFIGASPTKDVNDVVSSRIKKQISKKQFEEKIQIFEDATLPQNLEGINNLYTYLIISVISIEKFLREMVPYAPDQTWSQLVSTANEKKIISVSTAKRLHELRKLRNNLVHGHFENIDKAKMSKYIETIENIKKILLRKKSSL
jgi:uncharacterized protein YutE (UPF0331/DUF86 family)